MNELTRQVAEATNTVVQDPEVALKNAQAIEAMRLRKEFFLPMIGYLANVSWISIPNNLAVYMSWYIDWWLDVEICAEILSFLRKVKKNKELYTGVLIISDDDMQDYLANSDATDEIQEERYDLCSSLQTNWQVEWEFMALSPEHQKILWVDSSTGWTLGVEYWINSMERAIKDQNIAWIV